VTNGVLANPAARLPASYVALDRIDVSDPRLYRDHAHEPYFARLRREDPVHYCADSRFGPYWSVTRYKDIMQVDVDWQTFSSDYTMGGIQIRDAPKENVTVNFIRMDPSRHDEQRKTVSPIVAPANLLEMESLIRERTREVLDGLPRNEVFDWVPRVSIELTTRMLATLFDFPFEDRHLLTYWSDAATADLESGGPIDTEEKRYAILLQAAAYFKRLFDDRGRLPPRNDLISMLAHGDATKDMPPREFLGNVMLLIVGGNDTTRNSMSGGLHAMIAHPDEWRKVRDDPALISSLVPEIIRWQTPVLHMRRTATRDTELGGKAIRKGDKVVMWYVSGNRDEAAIERPDEFIVDRARPRQHLSFGFGVHRCVGNRLAELQLRILWEEILPRFPAIELAGTPQRTFSNFVHGYTSLPVRIPA
jgi:cytochrome P450